MRSEDTARTALEDQYGFTIVTDAPIRIITDENGTVFYTILIEREVKEELKFENLMIKVEDEETTAAIFKYNMTGKGTISEAGEYFFPTVENSEFTDLNVEGKVFYNSDTGEACVTTTQVMCNATWAGEPYNHIANLGCYQYAAGHSYSNLYESSSTVCFGSGGGGGTGGGTGSGGGGTGGSSNNTGGLGGSGGNNQPIDVTPIPCRTGNCIEADHLIKTPCQSLNDLFLPTKGNITSTMAQVNTDAIDYIGEKGAYFTNTGGVYGQHIITTSSSGGTANNFFIDIPLGPTIYAAVHSHPIDSNAVPMFSFADLETLFKLYRATNVDNRPDVTFMLLLPDGNTYAIKIDDFLQFSSYLNSYNSIKAVQKATDKNAEKNSIFDFRTKQGAVYNDSDMEEKYVRGFLDEMKNNGVSLYRKTTTIITSASSTTTTVYGWEKLQPPVNPSGSLIQETPCN